MAVGLRLHRALHDVVGADELGDEAEHPVADPEHPGYRHVGRPPRRVEPEDQKQGHALEAGLVLRQIDPHHPALWPATEPWRGLALGGLVPAISGVIAGGAWVGEPGRPEACLDLPEVREWIAEATARHRALLERAGLA